MKRSSADGLDLRKLWLLFIFPRCLRSSRLLRNKTCCSYFMEMHLFRHHNIPWGLTDLKTRRFVLLSVRLLSGLHLNEMRFQNFETVSSKAHYMVGWFRMCHISPRTTRRGHCHVKSPATHLQNNCRVLNEQILALYCMYFHAHVRYAMSYIVIYLSFSSSHRLKTMENSQRVEGCSLICIFPHRSPNSITSC